MRIPAIAVLLSASPAFGVAGEPGSSSRIELRLDRALQTDNPKTRDWVLCPLVEFELVGGVPRSPVIELKRGWAVPSWKGVVDEFEIDLAEGGFAGSLSARVNSGNVISSGRYSMAFEAEFGEERITGSYRAKLEGGKETRGSLSGRAIPIERQAESDPDEVWTLQLVGGLPDDKVLTVYFDRGGSEFNSAFGFSPNFTRRPVDVDASKLSVAGDVLKGELKATRLDARQPDGGERSTFGTYQIEASVEGGRVRGRFEGTTVEGQAVAGEVLGETRARRPLGEETAMWLKLEDGFAGGAMWQNRVFFKFTTRGGEFVEGKADNNKGVFDAVMTGAQVEITDSRLSGTLRATVKKSGSVDEGDYTFRLKGQRAGDVLYGRFYTQFGGKELHSGYFVGGIDR